MIQLKKGVPQTVALGQSVAAEKTCKLSVIGESGEFLKNSSGADLSNITLSYADNKYSAEITISNDEPDQYIRLYFSANVDIESQYNPQDAKLVSGGVAVLSELVPVQYFVDYVLNAPGRDPLFSKAANRYISSNREGIRESLTAAESELEREAMLHFSEVTLTEMHDCFRDAFYDNFWQFNVAYPPINDLVSFDLYYNDAKITNIDKTLFTWDRMMSQIEFMPVTGNFAAMSPALIALSGLSAVLSGVTRGMTRVPNLYRVTYKTGLVFPGSDEKEKSSVRMAVCRRALINLLPSIDNSLRQLNSSESLDGASASKSFQTGKMIEDMQKQEEKFIKMIQAKYGTGMGMVLV